jgi:hypothetical protein
MLSLSSVPLLVAASRTTSDDDLRSSFFKVRGTDYLLEEVNMPLCQLGVINRFRAERLRPELTLITQNECQEVCLIFRSWWGVCFFFRYAGALA